jgi:tetratricopeptide (TPR) repeat protein
VDAYTVTLISDDGQDRPPSPASGGELVWPADWPPLEPRATYVLVVEGDGVRSDQGNEEHAGLGFWLLSAADAEAVTALESRLRGQTLSPTATDLLVAELYLGHGLRAEATQLLEGLTTSDGAASVWLALGQAYLEAGVTSEALTALDQAETESKATGQQDVEAAALVGLGLVARLQDDGATAEAHLQAARALYEQIGDRDGVEQVDWLLSD